MAEEVFDVERFDLRNWLLACEWETMGSDSLDSLYFTLDKEIYGYAG